MVEQNLKATMVIYDNMLILANFVKKRATKQETIALLEALKPLNDAIRHRLKLIEGDIVNIDWNEK